MTAKVHINGLDDVIRKLNEEVQKIEGRTLKGLIRAAIVVRRDMDKVPPMIPVDLGNLRSSYFLSTSEGKIESTPGTFTTDKVGQKVEKGYKTAVSNASQMANKLNIDGPYVVLGFGAYYAAYVHEMVSANFKRPGAGAKFLENALDRNTKVILEKIAKEAQIK